MTPLRGLDLGSVGPDTTSKAIGGGANYDWKLFALPLTTPAEASAESDDTGKILALPVRSSSNAKAGSLGGKKASKMYGQSFRENRASLGGRSTLTRYGRGYFRAIALKRWSGR